MEKYDRKYPFSGCKIDDPGYLIEHEGRLACPNCYKSRKYFCYTCNVPLKEFADRTPNVKIPIKVDIIKHKDEGNGKSTSGHAKILAPDDVAIHVYPNIPDYSTEEGVFLVFPAASSISVKHLLGGANLKRKENFGLPYGDHMGTLLNRKLADVIEEETLVEDMNYDLTNLPIKKAVFIDSTWNQCRSIYKDPRVNCLRTIVIQNRLSQFWRHQRGSPRWFLSTIESIHELLLEIHIYAFGLDPDYRGLETLEITLDDTQLKYAENAYRGNYDNLLFFFQHFYDLIHRYYDAKDLLAYKRPIL